MSEEEILKGIEKIEEIIKKTLMLYNTTKTKEAKEEVIKTLREYFRILSQAEDSIVLIYAYLLFGSDKTKKEIRYVV